MKDKILTGLKMAGLGILTGFLTIVMLYVWAVLGILLYSLVV